MHLYDFVYTLYILYYIYLKQTYSEKLNIFVDTKCLSDYDRDAYDRL